MPADPPKTASGSNIYRDGDLLVTQLNGAVFPDRCVVTNQPAATKFHYREKITPRMANDMARYAESAWKGASFAMGAAAAPVGLLGMAAILATMKTVNLDIGLSTDWQTKYRRRKSRALWLVFGGLFGTFVLSWLVSSLCSWLFPALSPETVAIFVMIPVAVTFFLIAMGGLLYFAVAVRQPIKIRTTDGRYAWFAGAHPDFLASLPAFPREPAPTSIKQAAVKKSVGAFFAGLDGSE